MNFSNMGKIALNYIKVNAPELLTGFAVVGVGATAYLAHRAGEKRQQRVVIEDDNKIQKLKREAEQNWDLYVPPVVVGTITVGLIVGSNRVGNKRTAAALAAYSFAERTLQEYKKHVVDEIGEKKAQKIQDKMAEERMKKTYDSAMPIIGDGSFLCHEAFTDRYFQCDYETLRRACNVINHKAQTGGLTTVTLDEFYDEIGLPYTSVSGRMGWKAERLMELIVTSALTPDNRPCLSFEYNYCDPL